MKGKPNMGNLLKQAQQLQTKMARLQEELEEKTVEASSGGGMVTAVVNGRQEILSINIEPEVINDVEETIRSTPNVLDVTDLKVRWHGHQLRIETAIAVRADATVEQGHHTAHEVEHGLHHRFAFPIAAVVHVTPYGVPDAHDTTAHHHW